MKTKLTVKTDVATFTRSTARTYTHLVVAKDVRHEVLEAQRVGSIATYRKYLAQYRETLASGRNKSDTTDWHRERTAADLASGYYVTLIAEYEAHVAAAEAVPPVTADKVTDWEVLGWAGRLDLARKLYASTDASRYRHVRIYDITTGQQVRW